MKRALASILTTVASILLALPVESRMEETGRIGTTGYYREYFPTGPWNYGILQEDLGTPDILFSEPELRSVGVNPWTETDAPLRIAAFPTVIPVKAETP